ncbi:MAG TPA: hypothetical protein VMZ06_01430 [Candidatus Bathyarchaeia archaeon]|nr:hypothetical protein [Candidatus Bathyarchaeia archaeon]
MGLISFLLILAMQAGAGNQDRQPYVIQLKDGTELVGFWEQRETQSGGKVRVELDTPWIQGPQRKMISQSDIISAPTQERPTATLNRRQKGYADAGLVQVSDSLVVPRDNYDRAQRARQMAGLDAAEGEQAVETGETSGADMAGAVTAEPGVAPPRPGFFEQWGAHIGLLLVAVLLTGLVVRMAFLSGD